MMRYVLRWLYRVYVGSVAMLLNDALHVIAGSNVFSYVLHCELPYYVCVIFVGFVFISVIICVLCIAVSIGSVIATLVVGG